MGDDGADVELTHAGLSAYLAGKSYQGWVAEPAVHEGAAESPHGRVRVFFNRTSHDALKAAALPLPKGSMIVKELFEGATLAGHAVMVKSTAASWTWWEGLVGAASPVVFGVDTSACTGCHTRGPHQDQVRSPVP